MTDNVKDMKEQWRKFVADNTPFEGTVPSDDANYMAHTIDDLFPHIESLEQKEGRLEAFVEKIANCQLIKHTVYPEQAKALLTNKEDG